jgi:hypothetical protein
MDQVDARIPLMAQQAQVPDLGSMYANASNMVGLMQQAQINRLNFAGTMALNRAMQDQANVDPTTGSPDPNKVMAAASAAGAGASPAVMQYGMNAATMAKNRADTNLAVAQANQATADTQGKLWDAHSKLMGIEGQLLSGIHDQKSYTDFLNMVKSVDPNGFSDAPSDYDPAYVQSRIQQAMNVKDQLDLNLRNYEAQTGRINAATQAGSAMVNASPSITTPTGVVNINKVPLFQQGQQSVGGGQPQAGPAPSSSASNNPGNIRAGIPWQGAAGSVGGFQAFSTPEAGIRAATMNVQSLIGQGNNTVSKLISAWAPPSENNTAAYIADVTKRTGLNPNAPIDPNNQAQMKSVLSAIFAHEHNGQMPTDSQINNGMSMASSPQATNVYPINPTTLKAQETQGTELGEKLGQYQDQAQESATLINQLKALKQLGPQADLGPGASKIGALRSLWATYGDPNVDPSKLSANAMIDQISNRLVLNARNNPDTKVAGAFTSAQQHLEQSANVERSDPKAAFNAKIQTLLAAAQRQNDIAQGAMDYAQNHNGVIDNNFETMAGQYAAQPLYNQKLNGAAPSQKAIQYMKANPDLATKLQFIQRYGVSPSAYTD